MSCIWFIFNLCLLVSFGHVNWSCICFHSNLAVYCLDESSLTYKVRRGLNWYLVPKYALLTRNIFSRHAVAYFMIFSFACEMLFLQLIPFGNMRRFVFHIHQGFHSNSIGVLFQNKMPKRFATTIFYNLECYSLIILVESFWLTLTCVCFKSLNVLLVEWGLLNY